MFWAYGPAVTASCTDFYGWEVKQPFQFTVANFIVIADLQAKEQGLFGRFESLYSRLMVGVVQNQIQERIALCQQRKDMQPCRIETTPPLLIHGMSLL